MTEKEIRRVFQDTGVLQDGHFRLSSGRHSDQYMQCARVFERPASAEMLCVELAERVREAGIVCDTVLGPALGAVLIAYELSRHLGVRNLFAEREGGVFALRRGFTLCPGERVLVVEDAVTTGGSAREVITLARSQGASVVGVGSLVDRSGGTVDFGVPFVTALRLDMPSWIPDECPLCAKGVSLQVPGSRRAPETR